MAQEKNTGERYNDALDIGTVKIADDVVALIAAFAAMEVEGVSGMAGDLDMNTVSKGGMSRSCLRIQHSRDMQQGTGQSKDLHREYDRPRGQGRQYSCIRYQDERLMIERRVI